MMESFVHIPDNSPFTINNIPFGIFSTPHKLKPRPGVAIGAHILDLKSLVEEGVFERYCPSKFQYDLLARSTLNGFANLGRKASKETRLFLQDLLRKSNPVLQQPELRKGCLVLQEDATMHLPFSIGDFTDFLNSRVHATNTHSSHATPVNMFSPPRAFSGRASSIVVSGTPIVRPIGHLFEQWSSERTVVAPTREMDVEVEMAFFVGTPSKQFERIPITEAEDHIFGVVLLNDWSTRDIQRTEDFPFAAFNAKNFASTVSPWVERIPQDVLPYLADPNDSTYDIRIDMDWQLGDTKEVFKATSTKLENAYWTFKQMLTFQTLAGCPMRPGDLIGTGTITGPDPSSICSLVEKTKNGTETISTPKGSKRLFVEDGDDINFTAWAGEPGKGGIGFGDCRGIILPARI